MTEDLARVLFQPRRRAASATRLAATARPAPSGPRVRARRWWWTVGTAALLFAAVGAWLYSNGLHPARPTTSLVAGQPRSPGAPRRLVVFAKGASVDMREYRPLLARLLAEPQLAGSDLLLYDHRLVRLTMGRMDDFATRLRAEIDAQWIRAGGYDDVVLAGHSNGGLLVRQAYLQAAGRYPSQPATAPWAGRVSRIVLLAAVGRGVDVEGRGGIWALAFRVCRYLPLLRESVMFDVLRGADFVTSVRVAWIRHMAELSRAAEDDSAAPRPPVVVQLVGTEDGIVHRDDNLDLLQFPTTYHIDLPGAWHRTMHLVELSPDSQLTYLLYRDAFVAPVPAHVAARRPPAQGAKRVIFLLHGLRSSRDGWVRDLGARLRERLPDAEVVESSYGRLSLLGFTLPIARRRGLRWFQDQYTEYLARHPGATFDVVAHSNGAYLLGESLSRVPSMQFDRVLLLGSVLPTDYPWRERYDRGQVRLLRTDRAAGDAVAAVLCSAMRGVGMKDVGPSGWRGFDETGRFATEVAWYPGGHSAALDAANLDSLAEFIATGRVGATPVPLRSAPEPWLRWLSALAPWIARALLALLAALALIAIFRRRRGVLRPLALVLAGAAAVVVLLDVL